MTDLLVIMMFTMMRITVLLMLTMMTITVLFMMLVLMANEWVCCYRCTQCCDSVVYSVVQLLQVQRDGERKSNIGKENAGGEFSLDFFLRHRILHDIIRIPHDNSGTENAGGGFSRLFLTS